MDPTHLFVQKENMSRLTEDLYHEGDPKRRRLLRTLLVEEEDRYGFHQEQIAMVQQTINASQDYINRQKQIVKLLKTNGCSTELAEKALVLLLETRNLYVNFYNRIAQNLGERQ